MESVEELGRMARQVGLVRTGLSEVKEEMAALVDCLSLHGWMTPDKFYAEVHRRRFSASRRESPFDLELTFPDVFGMAELAPVLREQAGLQAMLGLRAASKRFWSNLSITRLREGSAARLYVCTGESNGQSVSTLECLDPFVGVWQALPSLRLGRNWACASALNGNLYVCGGTDGRQALHSVECFSPASCSWRDLPGMRHAREGAAAAAACGHLFVFGGGDGQKVLDSTERFDFGTSQWHFVPPMFHRRMGLAASTIDGQIYACGGSDTQQSLAVAERYTPISGSPGMWEIIPSMSQRRERFGAAALDGYLYVCGGSVQTGQRQVDVLASVERFNPATGTWGALPPMPQSRVGVAACAMAGQLWVCGGSFGRQDLRSCDRYDPASTTWEQLPPMLAPRMLAAGAAFRV